MKRNISIFCAVIMLVMAVFGCGNAVNIASEETPLAAMPESGKKLSIVTTIFPEYDWVKELLGSNPADIEVTMLLDNGVDLHSYQPTADDILKIATCDLFIYVGGESDEWVEDALSEATNKDMIVVNLLDALGSDVKEEEIIEGMEAEEEDEPEGEEGEEAPEYDEHVWLSIKNTVKLCEIIKDSIIKIDAGNAAVYEENATSYISKLDVLDNAYAETISSASVSTLLFGDRFPFRYMVDDYGLSYYAAFVGCSAETEASFETITFLANKMDELSLGAIMTIEGDNHKIAETIKENTSSKDALILSLDSMQSTTSKDAQDGTTYLGVMENNLEVLKEALK